MKPILILQHPTGEGPACLCSWLQRRRVPFEVRNIKAGDAYPAHMNGHAALAVLGGEMSARKRRVISYRPLHFLHCGNSPRCSAACSFIGSTIIPHRGI
jgi:hypothetical protein